MPQALTTPQKAYQRRDGQWSKWYLGGCIGNTPYSTIYTAQLGTPPTTTDDVVEIAFVSGSGTLADVLPDMTLYVGTTAGAHDLGMCRIRKAPIAGTFYIAEVSDVNWLAGGTIYLTVVDDYMLVARQIYMDPSTNEFFMDVDVAYTDQNTNPDPQPQMGCHRLLYSHTAITALATATIKFGPESGQTTYMPDGSSVSSITWRATGPASISFSNTHTANPTLTIQAPGKYCIYLSGTGSNGKTFEGVRYLFVHDPTCLPISQLKNVQFQIDYSTGGWYADVTVPVNQSSGLANTSSIRDRAFCILFTEDFAMIGGATGIQYTPAAPLEGGENIAMMGWIQDETIVPHPEYGEITFRIQSAHYWFGISSGFTVGVELNPTPSAWIHIPGLTVDLGIHHILHWRSTASRIMDIGLTGDTRYAQGFQPSGSDIWSQISEIAGSFESGQPTIGAQCGIDRWGRFFVQIDAQIIPTTSRSSIPIITDIFIQDIEAKQEPPNIKRSPISKTSQIQGNGVYFNVNATPTTFFMDSPGHIMKRQGTQKISQNWLAFSDQTSNNNLVGYLMGWDNNLHPVFTVTICSFIRAIDCFPAQYLNLVIPAIYDPRGEGYSGNVIIRSIRVTPDAATGRVRMSLTLEAVTLPELSSNGDAPPAYNSDSSGIPPMPQMPYPPILPAPIVPGSRIKIMQLSNLKGVYYTLNGDTLYPNWLAMNNGLPDPAVTPFVNVEITASGKCYVQCGTSGLYYAPSLGAPWQLVLEAGQISGSGARPALPPSSPYVQSFAWDLWNAFSHVWPFAFTSSPMIISFGVDRDNPERVLVTCGVIATIGGSLLLYNMIGVHGAFTIVSTTFWNTDTVGNTTQTGKISFGDNHWTVFWRNSHGLKSAQLNNAGASPLHEQTISASSGGVKGISSRSRFSSVTVTGLTATDFFISQDNAATFSTLSPSPGVSDNECIDTNGGGSIIIMSTGTGVEKSTDGGGTWSTLTLPSANQCTCVRNLGTDNDWIISVIGHTYYTPDGGTTFIEITGDLQTWLGATYDIILARTAY